jgi:threonine dehydratase
MGLPITIDDVLAARARIAPYLRPTAFRGYAPLDEAMGDGVRLVLKHENHQPTGSFKARNGLSAMLTLSAEERRRGVIAASTGNHGQGLAWAGQLLGVPVTICAPVGNNPEKNRAMRGFGAKLHEVGRDYDDALAEAHRLVRERGLHMVHSTNDRAIIAGAATMTLEMVEEDPALDALVVAVGGGSQAVGAITVGRARRPEMPIYGVQAERASAIHDSWHAGRPLTKASADTFAEGLATRSTYELTFEALREGLTDFITVTEEELAEAIRICLRYTHNLAEASGAAGLSGARKLRERLSGKRVGIILSGGNIDEASLRRVLCGTRR